MRHKEAWTDLEFWLRMKVESNNRNGCITSRAVAQRYQEVLSKMSELEDRHHEV